MSDNRVIVHHSVFVSSNSQPHIHRVLLNHTSSSIAWFPLLFYSTVYVGELHKRASPLPPDANSSAVDALEAEANRLGSRALFYSSLISLLANIVLPFFVREAMSGSNKAVLSPALLRRRSCLERMQLSMVTIWALSLVVFSGCMLATL